MRIVMGVETEYSVDSLDKDLPEELIAGRLYRLAASSLPHLPTDPGTSRIFLETGGCLYEDMHLLEYAGPECASPWDVVKHVRAGDEIVLKLARQLSQDMGADISVSRGNVGYCRQPQTRASHESYLTSSPPSRLADGLVPFLVSRSAICGGGGFDPWDSGIRFSLSPRTSFIERVSSSDTTCNRGIVNLKDEPLGRHGHHRLHLIVGDSLGSELSIWLKAATTSLVVRLLDRGYIVPPRVVPVRPLRAMRIFAADPSLTVRVPTANDHRVGALDIQWEYLQAIEERCSDGFPEWTGAVLQGWRRILELLQEDPNQTATALDWSIKLALYRDFCNQQGVESDKLPAWNGLLDRITTGFRRANQKLPDLLSPATVLDSIASFGERSVIKTYLRKYGLDADQLPEIQSLRGKLFELESRYLKLGDGIFAQLEAVGVLNDSAVATRDEIQAAMSNPPAGTRAHVRGRSVRRLAGSNASYCSWTRVVDGAGNRSISLENPLVTTATWRRGDGEVDCDDDELVSDESFAAFRERTSRRRRSNG